MSDLSVATFEQTGELVLTRSKAAVVSRAVIDHGHVNLYKSALGGRADLLIGSVLGSCLRAVSLGLKAKGAGTLAE